MLTANLKHSSLCQLVSVVAIPAFVLVVAMISLVTFIMPVQAAQDNASRSAANEYIEEIIVTADFRNDTINTVAGSVSVVQPNQSGTIVTHLEEVLGQLANVSFSSGASRGRYVQIRGVGERGQFDEPLNSSVGLIVDGVDLSGVGAVATLFDVQQVEVLRGPQGTLYGANALAGLINIVTPDATDVLSGYVRADVGDHGAFGLGGVISGPINDQLGYRISAQRYRDDGFIENDFLNRDNTANHDETTVRAKFNYSGDAVDWRLSLGFIDVDNGYDNFSLDNVRTTLTDEPGFDRQETAYAAFGVGFNASDSVYVEGSISLAVSDIDYGFDEDWTFTGFDPIGYTSTDRYERERDTSTFELRFLSEPGAGLFNNTWDWVAGVFALRQDVALDRQNPFIPGPFASDFEISRTAIYGELSRALTERLRLTLGARYERHESEYDDSNGVDLDPKDDLFGGRVLLEMDVLASSFVYAGFSQGYSASGFNTDGTLPADLIGFDEETLWNFEIGFKSLLMDDRLNLRLALFRMQRDDIQIATSLIRPIAGSNAPGQFIQLRSNAAEGYNQGLELEMHFQATDQLSLFSNIGLLDTEYDDFVDASGVDQDGREQAQAPNYQFFVGAEYAFTDRWSLRIELEGRDEYFFSDSHDTQSDAYELLNASLSYTADNWSVRAWGRNLTDEDYFVRGFFFGNDPRDFYTERSFTQLGEPRQVGITAQMNF